MLLGTRWEPAAIKQRGPPMRYFALALLRHVRRADALAGRASRRGRVFAFALVALAGASLCSFHQFQKLLRNHIGIAKTLNLATVSKIRRPSWRPAKMAC